MPKYKELSGDDLLLAIDRTRIAMQGQKLVMAKLAAGVVTLENEVGHRKLVDTFDVCHARIRPSEYEGRVAASK